MNPSYQLFYHPKVLGDVLLVMFEAETSATHFITHDDVTIIYHDQRLIGVNIFKIHDLIRIHAFGLIFNPPDVLIKILNDKFANEAIDIFLPPFKSGFVVGRVIKMDASKIILSLGANEISAKCYEHLKIGDLLVVARPGTILPTGKIHSLTETQALICTESMFGISEFAHPIIVETPYQEGEPFLH